MHTFPVHRSFYHFFQTSVFRVLQIMVIPQNCTSLEWLKYNQLVLNEFDLQSLIKNYIALKEVFICCIGFLDFGNFFGCQRVYFFFLTVICKHLVQSDQLFVCCDVTLIIAMPVFRKRLPSNGIFLDSAVGIRIVICEYSPAELSVGLYSRCDVASATVLCIPLIQTILGAYSSSSNLHRYTLSEVKPKASLVRFFMVHIDFD